MRHVITRGEFNANAHDRIKNEDNLRDLYMWRDEDDPDDDMTPFDALSSLLSQMTDNLKSYYAMCGLSVTNDEIAFNDDTLDVIAHISNVLMFEYNGISTPHDSLLPDALCLWRHFKLSGDDDVDYCSTHVSAFVDVMREYLNIKT